MLLLNEAAFVHACYRRYVMSPRTHPAVEPVVADLSPEVEAQVRAGIEAVERGEVVPLTSEEVDHWAQTGELPERARNWAGLAASTSRNT
jgi:hypothetical protein